MVDTALFLLHVFIYTSYLTEYSDSSQKTNQSNPLKINK
uniref:Uncharacterized protein n=1 Tax=Anguilla anguilla TaxID=7936 RepID=A0A0E9VQJ1_ANGAN